MAEHDEIHASVLEQHEQPAAAVSADEIGPALAPSTPNTSPNEHHEQAVAGDTGDQATPISHRPGTWHAAAGRKGAERIRQLIQEGRLYEQEHGLKSGRQRLRQLIEEGKRYEQEHGLPGGRKISRRPPRVGSQQSLLQFMHSFQRLAKPRVRAHIQRLIEQLEQENN
jgi:hypothetical protein